MKKITRICAGAAISTTVMLGAAGNDTRTVMFVGDSISCGVGASHNSKRFTTVAVKLLNNDQSGVKYLEKNIAVSGSCMAENLWPIPNSSAYPHKLQHVIAAKPDIVVMQHGVNDQTAHSSIGDFAWSYRQFVREAKAALPDTIFVCMTITPTRRGGEMALFHDTSNTVIQEVAAKEGMILVPIHQKMDGKLNLFPDGLHPNDEGHRMIAENLVAAIKENHPQSAGCFDFSMRRNGTFRIMGYVFFIPEATAEKGITSFYSISKEGFTYSSYGDVTVSSPFCIYPKEIKCFGTENALFRYDKYHRSYSVKLPSTNGKKVTISFL